ncbi:MAG: hypothetical protein RLZZ385_322 [Pseudomonadota bacterium]|jgi:hypothetical protein
MKKPVSHSLLALSTTALALPGIGLADSPPLTSTLSYKFSLYQEDDVPIEEAPFGRRDRYDIDVHQLRFITPLGRDFGLQVDANVESMSGASPWFTTAGANGNPIVNLSGASGIHDRRNELAFSGSYYMERSTVGATLGYSEEDDYRAVYGGVDLQRSFNNELTTLAAGISYSADDIFPADAALFNRIRRADKTSVSAVVSISQVIDQTSVLQSAINITGQDGYLSDPYKLRDVRPDDKTQLAWATAYRKFLVDADAALHANYRLYRDDFGIRSHTVDAAWHQNVGDNWQIVPHLRYYNQSAADFYTNIDNFLTPPQQAQSSDYRLSAFGAFSGGINVVTRQGNVTLTLATERYVANEKYALHDVALPGTALVRYMRLSLGIDYSF